MNRNRKKTVMPLEYQIESFFKKVLYLNHELITKKIDKNSKPLDIENLDLETLIYEGMKRYEELINIFEKEEDKEKKKHKKPFNKNKADAFNLGKRRSENIIDYRFNMNDISNKNEQNNDDLDNSRTSKKNLKFGSSYDKYLKNLKYNFKVDISKIKTKTKILLKIKTITIMTMKNLKGLTNMINMTNMMIMINMIIIMNIIKKISMMLKEELINMKMDMKKIMNIIDMVSMKKK